MISYGKQSINLRDRFSVFRVLGSSNLTQGPTTLQFESEVAKFTGAKGALAFNSATSALHAACLALDVGAGDMVWTSAISFVASANCAIYCGADVDFIDVVSDTGNISIDKLKRKLKKASSAGTLPKVIIPVHFAGQPCDLSELSQLSKEFGFRIIEDASHALGATYRGSPIGACEYSDITIFSFHPVKMITTGEGGMATSNSDELLEKLRLTRSHGITRDPNRTSQSFDGPWFYDQISLGYNFRMSDVQAALGLSQLNRLKKFVAKRNKLANLYSRRLIGSQWQPLRQESGRTNSYHLFIVQSIRGQDREEAYKNLVSRGIVPNVHYRPIYRNTFYKNTGKFNSKDFPGAENFYRTSLSIPLFVRLRKHVLKRIIRTISEN